MPTILSPRRTLSWRAGVGCMAAVVMLVGVSRAAAQSAVIDFEDQPAGTTVTTQYNDKGVIFDRAFLSNASIFSANTVAHSGTRVLRSDNPINEFHSPPLVIMFTSPQAAVRLFAGSEVVPINATMTAFDAANNVVGTDGPKSVAADVFNTEFKITTTSAVIMRVELQYEGTAFEAIDDLEFEGEPPAPPPLTPPVVTITAPANNSSFDTNTLDITGTVTGEGLLSPVRLTMVFARPPGTTAPPFGSDLALTGTGTTRQFALNGFTGLPMGPITITVEAENTGGLKGSATVNVSNFPAAILARRDLETLPPNSKPPFGNFSFGHVGDGCRIAIFADGAISVDGANATKVFRGDILAKWLSLRTSADPDGFGCPTSEERDGPGPSRIQDFQKGRIYANVENGPLFVPNVFLDVIETREMESLGPRDDVGTVPLSDPIQPNIPIQERGQTFLFQRFVRPDRPDLLPSTLEIRASIGSEGSPGSGPILWIERQSGTNPFHTGTLWENYPCSGNLGPCDVQPPPRDFPPIENAADICGGVALEDKKLETAACIAVPGDDASACGTEWTAVKGNYVSTPIFGVVTRSALAGEDFYYSHEWFYNCPGETVRIDCPSDWNLDVVPIGPHRGVEPHPSIFAPGNTPSGVGPNTANPSREVELEYENFYAEFVVWMGFPRAGDLIYAVGRWIIDCGHNNFKSELHPIFMYAKMTTVTQIINPFTGIPVPNPFGGQPAATRADIWVNGWYPGGDKPEDAIEFDIYPPPRPSPTARLVVNKPVDEDAVTGLNFEYSIEPEFVANHVHLKITAPLRKNHVTTWGEMKYQSGRGYEGRWYVYWAE